LNSIGTWDEHRTSLLDYYDADLARVDSAALVFTMQATFPQDGYEYWIGLHRSWSGGYYSYWSDGFSVSYTNWAFGEPNLRTFVSAFFALCLV
jgi:hypothetical protein